MKDILCSYYTESDPITSYMVNQLNLQNRDTVFEPCVGTGAFIGPIFNSGKDIKIDAAELDEYAIKVLTERNLKISPSIVDSYYDKVESPFRVKLTDTLIDTELDNFAIEGGRYSKIIGNPPYGAWQDYKKRDLLKKKFPDHYIKDSYAVFLIRCIDLLQEGGRLSFIIPDTFLFLNMHKNLRKKVFSETRIVEILLFPSKFFPGVCFGYSGLSIITLEKGLFKKNEIDLINFSIISGFKSSEQIAKLSKGVTPVDLGLNVTNFNQGKLLETDSHQILINNGFHDFKLDTEIHLGDIASIVTGFYTGNNRKYIKVLNKSVKGSKNYQEINQDDVYSCTSLTGIQCEKNGYIPYIKSSSPTKYFRPRDDWFVQWDSKTIEEYKGNKKTRFQNSTYYFKTGIGIPMVKSSKINAFFMTGRVFDQSIVGIFPKDLRLVPYILALMNSDVINDIIHTINPTANNSANYLKKIPFVKPDKETFSRITENTIQIELAYKENNLELISKLHQENNVIFSNLYSH